MAILQIEKGETPIDETTSHVFLTILLTEGNANLTQQQLDGLNRNIKDVTITTRTTSEGIEIKGEATTDNPNINKFWGDTNKWETVYFPKVVNYLNNLVN